MRFLLREYSRRAADFVKPENMTDPPPEDAPAPLGLEAARFLLESLGDGALWRWLSQRDQAGLRGEITKSFKSAPASLRHGLVKTRFARHLQRHQKDLRSLLKLWAPSQIELLRELQSLAAQNDARVLTESEAPPETSAASADSTLSNSAASANSDDAPASAPPDFDFSEEVTQSLRARFDEHAVSLAQLFLQSTPPDDEFLAGLANFEAASTRDAAKIFPAVETPTGDAISRDASANIALNADEKRAAASTRATQNEAPHEKEIAVENRDAASTREMRNEAARETLQSQLSAAKVARDAQRQRARELSAEIETLKTRHQRELHELRAQLVQAQKDAETQHEKAVAAQKTLERETRRAKNENAQRETFEAENKSLKRQLRQSQQSAEDARKTAATATAQLQTAQENDELLRHEIEDLRREKASAAPLASTRESASRGAKKAVKTPRVKAERVGIEAPRVAPIAPRVLDPLDEVFRWNAAAGDFAVTLRETREMISRNDETRVFALSRALETLRESDEKTYFNFLARARAFGAYFRRVLTATTTRVLVDASNVARIETDRRGRGKLDFLLQAREELRRRDAFPLLLVADASLQHFIDEPGEVAKMATRGELELLPAGNVADDFLAREARRTGAFVLTNDKGFHKQVAPDFEPSRIGFRLRHNFIEIDDF